MKNIFLKKEITMRRVGGEIMKWKKNKIERKNVGNIEKGRQR